METESLQLPAVPAVPHAVNSFTESLKCEKRDAVFPCEVYTQQVTLLGTSFFDTTTMF